MVYHSGNFTKVEGEFEQFFYYQMADGINYAADNNTNPLKRLPVLVRILFKFSSRIIIQHYFLSRYYEDYYIYLFDKHNFLSSAQVIKRSRIFSLPSNLVKCSSYYWHLLASCMIVIHFRSFTIKTALLHL